MKYLKFLFSCEEEVVVGFPWMLCAMEALFIFSSTQRNSYGIVLTSHVVTWPLTFPALRDEKQSQHSFDSHAKSHLPFLLRYCRADELF